MTVGNIEGKTFVKVSGRDVTPGESRGWIAGSRKLRKPREQPGERPLASERQSRPKEKANFVKRVTANIKREARMPATMPREDFKIVMRPRGGLNVARIEASVVTDAVMAAAGTAREHEREDMVCVNAAQNILVVSTPSEQRADVYARVKSVTLGGMSYEVYAYRTAPEGTVKGVIRGIAIEETPEDINDAIVTKYNPLALEAHRIGNTTAVIVLFEGPKVPRYVKYRAALLKCGLYKKHHEVCKCCGKVGHRIDVCPNPEAKVCFACGAANPNTEHEATCKPRCKLCGGAHPTGDRACKNKFKVPFVVTKRRWERKAEQEQQQQQKERLPNASDFPPWQARRESRRRSESRQRSASRGRDASRRRTPSQRGEKITWAQAANGASSGKTLSATQRQGNEEPMTRSEAIEIIKANNEKIHAKLKEHDEMIKRINEKLAILLEALVPGKPKETQEPRREPTPPNEPREEKREVVAEEEAARSSTASDDGRQTEPCHKKRVVENTKERRLQARLDRMDEEREQLTRTMKEKFNKLDERFTSVEQSIQGIQNGMVQLQAQIQSVMQNVEVQIIAKLQQLWTQPQATSQPQQQ